MDTSFTCSHGLGVIIFRPVHHSHASFTPSIASYAPSSRTERSPRYDVTSPCAPLRIRIKNGNSQLFPSASLRFDAPHGLAPDIQYLSLASERQQELRKKIAVEP